MNADKTRQNCPKQAADTVRPGGERPARTHHVRRTRILVMHGDQEIRALIAASLTLEGFDVTTAAGSRDGLYKVRAAVPDIVITTSENVPEPGGCATAAQLRRHLADSRIKVVYINSVPRPECGPGTGTCLTAPFDPAEMIRTVRNLGPGSPRR